MIWLAVVALVLAVLLFIHGKGMNAKAAKDGIDLSNPPKRSNTHSMIAEYVQRHGAGWSRRKHPEHIQRAMDQQSYENSAEFKKDQAKYSQWAGKRNSSFFWAVIFAVVGIISLVIWMTANS